MDDLDLWKKYLTAEGLLKPSKKRSAEKAEDFATLLSQPVKEISPKKTLKAQNPAKAQPPPPSGALSPSPPDKNILRKIAQGKIKPQAVLDLHGKSQTRAHDSLAPFIEGARKRGLKYVLIITGKGKGQATADNWITPGKGLLKEKLPQWLAEPSYRTLIEGFITAPPAYGGNGAYFVILRKIKHES